MSNLAIIRGVISEFSTKSRIGFFELTGVFLNDWDASVPIDGIIGVTAFDWDIKFCVYYFDSRESLVKFQMTYDL